MSSSHPVLQALKRFVRDAERDGMKVVAWPTSDPSFHIEGIQADRDYFLIFGVDEQKREGMLVMPASHLALQMRCEKPDEERKSMGFISPDKVKDGA